MSRIDEEPKADKPIKKPEAGAVSETRGNAQEVIEMSEVEQHVLGILGASSFEVAMHDEENFYVLIGLLDELKEEFEPERLAEILMIAAKAFPAEFINAVEGGPNFPEIDQDALQKALDEARKRG